MSGIVDHTGYAHPETRRERIVSLVPSTTETIFELGASEREGKPAFEPERLTRLAAAVNALADGK